MPTRRLSERMSPEEILAHQRERNRKKQKAFKDRQKSARITAEKLELDQQKGSGRKDSPSPASPTPPSPIAVTPTSEPPTASPIAPPTPVSPPAQGTSPRSSQGSARCDDRPSRIASSADGRSKARGVGADLSLVASSSRSHRYSPVSLFGSLFNDSPPARLLPNPRATSFLPRTLNVNVLRESLGLPAHIPQANCLPSFTYTSPVDHSHVRPPVDSSWKVALFALHSAMIANRANPVDGFIHNQDSRRTLAEAQLMISQLLYSTSPNRALFTRSRQLSQEDANFLANTVLDARIKFCADPIALVQLARASLTIDITEMGGLAIEQSRIYGDVWDSGSSSLPDDFCDSVPPENLGKHGHRTEAGRNLRGASIREIVLGLDEPGWRNTAPVFPQFEASHWKHMEEIFAHKTHGPMRKEGSLVEIA